MTEVKLPPLAEGVDKASVSYWHHSVGDNVKEGEDLVELVTDKAAFNVPAEYSGKVKKINVKQGQEVSIGDVLVIVE